MSGGKFGNEKLDVNPEFSKSDTSALLCVDVEGGKYTIKQDEGGKLHALRYGEEWRDLCGDGMVYALAAEVERLREKINDAKNCVVCAGIADPIEVCENTLAILDI